jgi:Domain of unknown function (DUF4399)
MMQSKCFAFSDDSAQHAAASSQMYQPVSQCGRPVAGSLMVKPQPCQEQLQSDAPKMFKAISLSLWRRSLQCPASVTLWPSEQLVLTGRFQVGNNASTAALLAAPGHLDARFPTSSTCSYFERPAMFKFCCGALTVATIAAAIGPASAQQPPTAPAAAAQSDTGQSTAPAGAYSYIVNLKNGDTVTSPFKVVFGLSPNMGVAPSGVEKPNVGHHHLLVDKALSPEEMTQPIMVDEQHIHFGKGQTETTVTLPPGKHTLQLILGDWTHIPFKPPVQSEVITVTVKGAAAAKPETKATMMKEEHHHHHHRHHHHRHH